MNLLENQIPKQELANPKILLCKHCKSPVTDSYFYCPYCGNKLKQIPLSTSLVKQIGIYVFCLLAPPLGLWPGIKYLLQKNNTAKAVGAIAIGITIVSTVITCSILSTFVSIEMNQIKAIKGQFDAVQQLQSGINQDQIPNVNTQESEQLKQLGL